MACKLMIMIINIKSKVKFTIKTKMASKLMIIINIKKIYILSKIINNKKIQKQYFQKITYKLIKIQIIQKIVWI